MCVPSQQCSIEYWFRCLDIDGDGILSLFELVYFYEEVLQRLQELNIDSISIENTVCQVLDMVNPKEKGEKAAEWWFALNFLYFAFLGAVGLVYKY